MPFLFVLAQAIVGGLATLMVLPKATVLIHACLAQLAFGGGRLRSIPSRCLQLDRDGAVRPSRRSLQPSLSSPRRSSEPPSATT